VEFQAMKIIVQLPFDATQKDLLIALSSIEGLQRPLRRSEKQCLNELQYVHFSKSTLLKAHRAHSLLSPCSKALKYKLEGPLSKARVQSPEQKAFVLLQASIGRLHLEDYSLRQEMQSMVEYASRILSAIEEYSAKGSLHGQVALQCLRLRRSFAASLWCGKDGALHQLKGLGAKSIANLKFHGITTFDDIINATTDLLEKVAQRPQPFGRNLQDVVGKILGSSLHLTAKLENASGSTTPSRVVCDLQPKLDRQDTSRQRPTPDSTVTYSVLAFTDLPGSCLYYKSDVTGGQTIEFDAPPSFGKITVVMVASLVGLDGAFSSDWICTYIGVALSPSQNRTLLCRES
jgi:Sec63 Brl domain